LRPNTPRSSPFLHEVHKWGGGSRRRRLTEGQAAKLGVTEKSRCEGPITLSLSKGVAPQSQGTPVEEISVCTKEVTQDSRLPLERRQGLCILDIHTIGFKVRWRSSCQVHRYTLRSGPVLGFLSRLLFTSTAVAPVLLVYAYALYDKGRILAAGLTLAVMVVLVVVAAVFLVLVRGKLQKFSVKFVSAETADQENIAFLLLYVSPLFTSDVSSVNFSVVVPVIFLFILVVMSGNNYHFNPLLNILGWHFYKVDTEDGVSRVLITRRSIRNVVDKVTVVQLTDYVVMEKVHG